MTASNPEFEKTVNRNMRGEFDFKNKTTIPHAGQSDSGRDPDRTERVLWLMTSDEYGHATTVTTIHKDWDGRLDRSDNPTDSIPDKLIYEKRDGEWQVSTNGIDPDRVISTAYLDGRTRLDKNSTKRLMAATPDMQDLADGGVDDVTYAVIPCDKFDGHRLEKNTGLAMVVLQPMSMKEVCEQVKDPYGMWSTDDRMDAFRTLSTEQRESILYGDDPRFAVDAIAMGDYPPDVLREAVRHAPDGMVRAHADERLADDVLYNEHAYDADDSRMVEEALSREDGELDPTVCRRAENAGFPQGTRSECYRAARRWISSRVRGQVAGADCGDYTVCAGPEGSTVHYGIDYGHDRIAVTRYASDSDMRGVPTEYSLDWYGGADAMMADVNRQIAAGV